jgi:hypothetical protein
MTNPDLTPGDPVPPIDAPYSPKLLHEAVARKFISLNGTGYFALGIVDGSNKPVDADANTVSLAITFDDLSGIGPQPEVNVDDHSGVDLIQRDDVGKYHYNLSPARTRQRGLLTATWTYNVVGVEFQFIDNMQILDQMPFYDTMSDDNKLLVEQSSWFFADLFDSTAGGPWLAENFQTHFDYNRIAFLMGQAVMKFNLTGFPVTSYGVTVNDQAVPSNLSGLTLWGTKLEVIRHLIVSYTEQPTFANMATTYTDRRDYADRWRAVLQEENPLYQKASIMAKRKLLNLGRGSALVAGGIYGGSARGMFIPGMYAAQTRSFRFYPAAPAVSFANQVFGSGF